MSTQYAYTTPEAFDTQQKLLYLIALGNGIQSGLISSLGNTGTSLPSETVTRTSATSSGTVASGFTRVTIVSDGSFSGTVQGATFPASYSETYTAQTGRTLGEIAYTRSAGTLYITTIS